MSVNPDRADKRGYLKEKFRLFHLKDRDSGEISYHYHEFHKLILFQGGELTYRVEGRSYEMQVGDLLLVPAHAIHQPVIGTALPCERTILWLQPEGLERRGLELCFRRCREENAYLPERDRYDRDRLLELLRALEVSEAEDAFGREALSEALFPRSWWPSTAGCWARRPGRSWPRSAATLRSTRFSASSTAI